jgi:N-acetylneuraminic acid mutarotase
LVFQAGTYGTQGIADPSNVPGGREEAVSWIDAAGNFWYFGGYGLDGVNSISGYGYLNDLWKYSGGEWTWVSGSNTLNLPGTYGTQGIASPSNVPGAREGAVSWIDAAGNLWLFGGNGFASSGVGGYLNDLWKYSAGEWTWMSGSNTGNEPGIYGTQGTAGPTNVPGGRFGAAAWIDGAGNLWLFGGYGADGSGVAYGYLNDLWKYNGDEWTWMGGSNAIKQQGTYGTKGLAAASNVPGARQSPTIWIDAAGNVWLFGGQGLDSTGTGGMLNDLWQYSSGEWTWVSGSNVVYQPGAYGTEGVAAASNVPGARGAAVGWIDAAGNLWLFGGTGSDSTGAAGLLNDLWEYEP